LEFTLEPLLTQIVKEGLPLVGTILPPRLIPQLRQVLIRLPTLGESGAKSGEPIRH
jgi:hypothetical protein